MKKFFMKLQNNKSLSYWGIALFASLVATLYINKGMFFAFIMLFLLMAGTFWSLKKYNKLSKKLAVLLCISLILHVCLVLFIQNTGFKPFGGGADYEGYNIIAKIIARNFVSGNFSLKGLRYGHDFPVLIAILYILFGSDPLVGLFFITWLFVLSVLFSYFIMIELGASEKKAFLIGLFVILYPSYAYFGSVLLKDTVVIPVILLSIWLLLRMVKRFSWIDYLVFFLLVVVVSYLRFYVGYALILSFIISWFLSMKPLVKEKLWLGITLSLILSGLAPFLALQGYFGYYVFDEFLNPGKITQYREISYNPDIAKPLNNDPGIIGKNNPNALHNADLYSGTGSSFVVKTGIENGPISFTKNSTISFVYTLFGPFAWQLRYARQLVSLIEVIPWYLYIISFIYFLIGFIRKEGFKKLLEFIRKTAPLWTFAIFALGALALFINNYGIIVRIRIPMIICLVMMMSLLFKKEYTLWFKKNI